MRRDLNPELKIQIYSCCMTNLTLIKAQQYLFITNLNLCLLHTATMKTVPFRVVNVHEDCKWHYSTQLGTAAPCLFCAYRMYLSRAVVFNLYGSVVQEFNVF